MCGEAANGNDAIAQTEQLAPDLAIIDLAMPNKNGIEAAREIFAISPLTPMLLLTVQQVSAELARAARDAGFRGAVTKSSGSEVVMAVETLLGKVHSSISKDLRLLMADRMGIRYSPDCLASASCLNFLEVRIYAWCRWVSTRVKAVMG